MFVTDILQMQLYRYYGHIHEEILMSSFVSEPNIPIYTKHNKSHGNMFTKSYILTLSIACTRKHEYANYQKSICKKMQLPKLWPFLWRKTKMIVSKHLFSHPIA